MRGAGAVVFPLTSADPPSVDLGHGVVLHDVGFVRVSGSFTEFECALQFFQSTRLMRSFSTLLLQHARN